MRISDFQTCALPIFDLQDDCFCRLGYYWAIRPFEFLWVKIYSLCKIGQLVWRMLRPNYTKDLDLFRACSSYFLRSEEHTSELQSLMRISYAVFCLKKKNTTSAHHT